LIAFDTIFFAIGIFLSGIACTMLAPGLVDFLSGDINWIAFALSGPITLFSGLLLVLANRPSERFVLSLRDTFVLTAFSWIAIAIYAALPFIFSNDTVSHTDSFFEAISGLTTTGASIMQGVDYASKGIVLWRSILQWLGGIGIVVMALTVMPALRIGGMQLFRNEFSDHSEKLHPKLSQVARDIFLIYGLLTVMCGLMLWMAGMPGFDAVCHALSTLSTGGFSSASRSVAAYNNAVIESILILFMIIGAITLLLFVRLLQGDVKSLVQDTQVKTFLSIVIFAIMVMTCWRYIHGVEPIQALRTSSFAVTSIITTTGYTTDNYNLWGGFPLIMLLILMQIGGCTGSTSGSVKVFRYHIMFAVARAHIAQMRRPHGIFIARYNGKQIPDGVFMSVFTFLGLYILSLGFVSLGLAYFDLDFITCISGAASALNNIGAAIGPVIGPDGSFAYLPDGAKWLLMFGMLFGRLEYVTLIILFSRSFWQD
jgi:trk system potassium uptake protein TrkH